MGNARGYSAKGSTLRARVWDSARTAQQFLICGDVERAAEALGSVADTEGLWWAFWNSHERQRWFSVAHYIEKECRQTADESHRFRRAVDGFLDLCPESVHITPRSSRRGLT